jgi:hypothetical protein
LTAEAPTHYCVDTSALIDGLERFYPERTFPGVWARVHELVDAGRFFISEEGWEEIKSRDEVAKVWCERYGANLIVPTNGEVVAEVRAVLAQFPRIVANMKNRNRADPFVVAVGAIRGATVLTGEGADGSANRPKIPFVCHERDIPCMRFVQLLEAEGWVFD